MEKVCSSKRGQLSLLRHLEFVMYDHSKPHVISHRHLTDGTGASEGGLVFRGLFPRKCWLPVNNMGFNGRREESPPLSGCD